MKLNFLYIKNKVKKFPGGPVLRTLLSLLSTQIQSLVGELKSHKPHNVAKKKKSENVYFQSPNQIKNAIMSQSQMPKNQNILISAPLIFIMELTLLLITLILLLNNYSLLEKIRIMKFVVVVIADIVEEGQERICKNAPILLKWYIMLSPY